MTLSDELLVSELSTVAQACAAGGDAVYHLEVYQNATGDNASNYPCFVYRRTDYAAELELSGQANVEDETYEVTVVSQDSDALRCMARAVQKTNKYEFLQHLQTTRPDVLDWIVEHESEQNEFAMEQQDKGYKTATMLVRIVLDTTEGTPTCPP